MWIIGYTNHEGEFIEIGPCSIDESDERHGWSSREGAEAARQRLNKIYKNLKRYYEPPIEVDEDHRLYTGT
jgi:hypothetical protein